MKDYRYSTSLYLGETTRGRACPVFFDLHTPIFNNEPPGCLITGAPGSGKTFLGLTLAAQSAILGKTTVILDPKGDFLSLIPLREDIGRFAVWDLSKGKPGLLDPFYMASSVEDKLTLAIDTIDIFVGGLERRELAVLSPIIKDIIASPNPSMLKVVDKLRSSEKEDAQHLGTQLELIRSMKFAKLCFAPGTGERASASVTKGLTVITLAGLPRPTAANVADMTRQERLGAGIMFLLTDFIRRIMNDDTSENPKTVIIDEAHAVIASAAGSRVISEIALLGRSRSLALLLITQNNSHLSNLNIENTISTRIAMKSDTKEAESIIAAMNLPQHEGFEEIIVNLNKGEALMKDYLNRYATIQVSNWRPDWNEAFSSNPLDRIERDKKTAAERKAAKEAKLSAASNN